MRVASELADERVARKSEREVAIMAKAAIEEAYECTKDSHVNFAYIMAFTEAI